MARRLVRIRLDAHVEQPWQRAGFRHPDLMNWVRANRARIVAACLNALPGMDRRRTSARDAQHRQLRILGADAGRRARGRRHRGFPRQPRRDDGGIRQRGRTVWRSFVSAWWDRFGTAEVGASDLYELALTCEPPLPLGFGNDRSQRIRLGKALGRVRDRMFRVRDLSVRVEGSGTHQGAQRWRLTLDEKTGTDKHSQHSPRPTGSVNVVNVGECLKSNIHGEIPHETKLIDEVGECRECFSNAYTCASARAYAIEGPAKHSQHSPHSPDPAKPRVSNGEGAGECRSGHSPIADPPAWLKEVP